MNWRKLLEEHEPAEKPVEIKTVSDEEVQRVLDELARELDENFPIDSEYPTAEECDAAIQEIFADMEAKRKSLH